MNKTKTEKLWKALCVCTCKGSLNGLYDTVLVDEHDNVYATNQYVIHRVEFVPELMQLPHYDARYMQRRECYKFDELLETSKRNYINLTNFYDPGLLSLALRPHKVLGSTVMLMCGRGKQPPLIIKSTTADDDRVICITTAIMGKRV